MKTRTIRWIIAAVLLVFAGWIFSQSDHWCPVSVAVILCIFALGVLLRVRIPRPRSGPEPHYTINSRRNRENAKTRT